MDCKDEHFFLLRNKRIVLLGQFELWLAPWLGLACVDEVILRLLETLYPEDVLHCREGHLFKDFCRPHSLILEKVLRAEVL